MPTVQGRTLGSSGRSLRGGEIGAWARRRRPRAQKHVRNVASVVPSDLYDDWRSLSRFLILPPKSTITCIFKNRVFLGSQLRDRSHMICLTLAPP